MGRFVKNASITRVPQRLAVVAVDRIECDGQYVLGSWHVMYCRRRSDNWAGKIVEYSGDNPEQLWQTLRILCGGMSRVYTIVEDGIEGMTLAGFWDEVKAGRMSIRPIGQGVSNVIEPGKTSKRQFLPLIMSDKVDVIGCNHQHGTLRLVSPINHGFDASRRARAEYLDRTEVKQYERIVDRDWTACPIRLRALAMLRYYQMLMRWWIIGNCGAWQDSIGALGLAWWKRHVPKRSVLIHDCERAHDFEVTACYGGRQQVFFHGKTGTDEAWQELKGRHPPTRFTGRIRSDLHEWDYRSMYVSIMRDMRFPVALIGPATCLEPSHLYAGTEYVDGLYSVTVNVSAPWLPFRRSRGVCYPIGEWSTTLTTPEFRQAYERNEIRTVHHAYLYRTGYPLREFAERALGMRWIAEKCNSKIAARLFKAVGNALGGKLAAHQHRWVDFPECRTSLIWGQFPYCSDVPGESHQCRVIAGRVQRQDRSDRRIPGLTAIYAHLTAYGRILAARVIEAAGPGGCVYWDTDGGLFIPGVDDRMVVFGGVSGEQPGELRKVSTYRATIHRAPKRHFRDGEYTISGVPSGFTIAKGGRVEWCRDLCGVRHGVDPYSSGVKASPASISFDSIASGVPVDSSGWAIPLIASCGELFTPESKSPSPSMDSLI